MVKYLIAFMIVVTTTSHVHGARGCCSSHKGVKECNASTGFLMCNDGTQSPSCTCPKAAPSQKGCCSAHGGVKGCDNKKGFLTCADGTFSPSCKCSGKKPATAKPTKSTNVSKKK